MNRPKLNAVFGPKATPHLKDIVNFAMQIATAASGEWMETAEVILHHHPRSPRGLITERKDKNTLRVRDSHVPPSDVPFAVIVDNTETTMATGELQLIHDFAEQFAEMRKAWNALPEIDGSETSLEALQEFSAFLNAGVANELMDEACKLTGRTFEPTSFHEDVHTPINYMVAHELKARGYAADANPVPPEVTVTVNNTVSWAIGTVNGTWELDLTCDDGGTVMHTLDTGIDDKCRDVKKICDALEVHLNFITPDKLVLYRTALDRIRIDKEIPDKREDMRDAIDRHVLIADEAVMGERV